MIVEITDPDVINFIQTYNVDVNLLLTSFIKSFEIPSLDSDSDNTNPNFIQIRNMFSNSLQDFRDNFIYRNDNQFNILKNDIKNEIQSFNHKINQNPCIKGAHSEKKMFDIITNLYTNREVTDNSKSVSSCDIKIDFDDISILIENKDYNCNVLRREIDKFKFDLNKNKMSGVMFSQNTGIASKSHFEIEILDPKNSIICMYVHNTQYDQHIIKAAIDMVSNLTTFLKQSNDSNTEPDYIQITPEQLSALSTDLNSFYDKINNAKSIVKQFEKDIISNLNSIKFNTLSDILNQNELIVGTSNNTIFKCNICNKTLQTKAGLTKHLKSHK